MTAGLSIQLYTLRKEARDGLAPVLERLAQIGYAGVEPAGFHDLGPEAFARHASDLGLQVSGSHVPLSPPDEVEALLDAQQAAGARDLVVAYLPAERFATDDEVARTADALNAMAERVHARGLRLGYHNHHWEFATRLGGETAHAALFARLDPEVFAEIDTYWAKVGGVDPAQVVADLGPRARLLHLKDGPADDPASPMTAVGDGVVDVAAIAAASAADWHVVELDRCATDMFEAVARSHAYLTGAGFAAGRDPS